MQEKRTKEIKIRVTADEFDQLQQRKTKQRLAEWLREVALEQQPKKKPKPVDPVLLYQLNKIGVNLNQIAKALNDYRFTPNLIKIAVSLENIDQDLRDIRDKL